MNQQLFTSSPRQSQNKSTMAGSNFSRGNKLKTKERKKYTGRGIILKTSFWRALMFPRHSQARLHTQHLVAADKEKNGLAARRNPTPLRGRVAHSFSPRRPTKWSACRAFLLTPQSAGSDTAGCELVNGAQIKS